MSTLRRQLLSQHHQNPVMDSTRGRMEFVGGGWGLTDAQKECASRIFETILRIPGVLLLELWWLKYDDAVHEFKNSVLGKSGVLPNYLKVERIIEFVDNRNMDNAVAGILSFAGESLMDLPRLGAVGCGSFKKIPQSLPWEKQACGSFSESGRKFIYNLFSKMGFV